MALSTVTLIVNPELPDPLPDEPYGFAVPLAPTSEWTPALSAPGLTSIDTSTGYVTKPFQATESSALS